MKTFFVPYMIRPKLGYQRIGETAYTKQDDANLRAFVEHVETGNGIQPYIVLPFEAESGFSIITPKKLPKAFKRTPADLAALIQANGSVTLSIAELRQYFLKGERPEELKGIKFDSLMMQSYGADNCDEEHLTDKGCNCWTGADKDDIVMLLDETRNFMSTYPAYAIWKQ